MKQTLGVIVIILGALLLGVFISGQVTSVNNVNLKSIQKYQSLISIFWAGLGTVWMAISIFDRSAAKYLGHSPRLEKQRFIRNPKDFINRKDDIHLLFDLIAHQHFICAYGQKGVGKSELLKYLTDILNGGECLKLLGRDLKKQARLLPKSAFYLDINDSVKWSESIQLLSTLICGQSVDSMSELAFRAQQKYGKKTLVIILDNINNFSAAQEVVRGISQYKNIRRDDIFITGSISRIIDPHVSIQSVLVEPFSENHCRQFLFSKGIETDEMGLQNILQKSSGLPLFLNFLSLNKELVSDQGSSSFTGYFISKIYSALEEEDKAILNFIAICNTVLTNIPYSTLAMSPFPRVETSLSRLREYSTLIETNYSSIRHVKVHDLIRDICLENNADKIPLNAKLASTHLSSLYPLESIILLAICNDCSPSELEKVVNVIRAQIEKNNYIFLTSFWGISEQWADSKSMFHSNDELKGIAIYGYMRALLGIGDYRKAEELLNSSSMYEYRRQHPTKINTVFEFELLYAIADLDHLLNRYELARSQVEILLSKAREKNWIKQKEKAMWLYAHLTGHIGDSLSDAFRLYGELIEASRISLDTALKLTSQSGQVAIELTRGNIDILSAEDLKTLISESEMVNNLPLQSTLWRNLARFHRLKGEQEQAQKALLESLRISQENNLRTVINCIYSQGENNRFQGKHVDAVESYQMVIDRTQANGDKNLCTSAILACCICDILNQRPIYASSSDNVFESISYVEKIANELDMKITSVRARLIKYFADMVFNEEKNASMGTLVADLTELGLRRDITILESGLAHLKHLEIHVH